MGTTSATATVGSLLALIEGDVWEATQDLVQQASFTSRQVEVETKVGKSVAVRVTPEDTDYNSSLLKVADKVIVPTDLLEANETVVIVVTEVKSSYLQEKLEGHYMSQVHGIVDVSIFLAQTLEPATLEFGSKHGILLKVAEAEPGDGAAGTCVYLEGETWSTEGVRRASPAELDTAQDLVELAGDAGWTSAGVWCRSEHLSVFAFLLRVCTSVDILTVEALEGVVFEANNWAVRRPALVLCSLMSLLGCVHVYAALADRRHQRSGLWFKRRLIAQSGLCSLPSRSLALLMRCHLTAQWGLSPRVLLGPYDHGCASKELASLPATASKELACLPHEVLQSSFGPRGWLLRLWTFYRAFHPLLTLGDLPLHISCSQSAKLFTDTFLGSLALQAIVFSRSGEVLEEGSDELCGLHQLVLGRMALVALLLAVASGLLMRALVHAIAREDDDGGSCVCWNATFWVLGLAWSSLLLAWTLAFLAFVSPREEWKWEAALMVLIAHLLVVIPLVAALALSVWVGLVVCCWPELFQQLKLGLSLERAADNALAKLNEERSAAEVLAELFEEQRVTVMNLAQRGISVQHLLEFYEKLGPVVMPHFNPVLSTTEDVVRQAVIPLSRKDADDVFGRPPRVKLGLMNLTMPLANAKGARCKCVVTGRVLLESWPVSSLEVDWSLEAEAHGCEPWDVLEVSLDLEGIELCAGCVQLNQINGQHEVELRSDTNERFGEVALHVTPPVMRASARAARIMGGCLCCDSMIACDSREVPASSWDLLGGVAYATTVGLPPLPRTLVTHNWAGTFAHLMASILADALGCASDVPLQMLEAGNMGRLRAMLGAAEKLKAAYWINAFAVNQHSAICGQPQRLTDSTGARLEPCTCSTRKILAGPACEMDQLPATRAYLKGLWLDQGKQLAELHVPEREFPAVLEL